MPAGGVGGGFAPLSPGDMFFFENSIAWNIGPSHCKDVRGGLVIDLASDPENLLITSSSGTTPASDGRAIGMVSTHQSGPLDVGSDNDKHVIGFDSDGHPIVAVHCNTNTYFRRNAGFDGPLLFEGMYTGGEGGQRKKNVELQYQPGFPHPFVCGTRPGIWRWISYSDWGIVPPPDVPPGDMPKYTPPTSGDGGGGGGGGGNVGGGNSSGGGAFFGGAWDFAKDVVTGFTRGYADAWSVYGKGAKKITEGAKEAEKKALQALDDAINGLGKGASKGGDILKDGASKVGDFLGDNLRWPSGWSGPSDGYLGTGEGYTEYGTGDYYPSTYTERPRPAPSPVAPWDTSKGWLPFSGSTIETNTVALSFRPQMIGAGVYDIRNDVAPSQGMLSRFDSTTPVVAKMEPFGKQRTGPDWGYTQTPDKSRYYGGTASGGIAYLPPEVDMADQAKIFAPSGITKSTTYHVAIPGVYWAAGLPNLATGGIKTAHRWSADALGDLLFECIDANGAATNALKLSCTLGVQIPLGGSSSFITSSGTVGTDLDVVGTGADTLETTLASVSLVANALATNGRGIRTKAWGTFAANANAKTIKLKFGAAIVATNDITTSPNGLTWELDAVVFRISGSVGHGGGVQEAIGESWVGAVVQSKKSTQPAEDDTAAIPITMTGQNGTAAANDIVCRGLFVEAL